MDKVLSLVFTFRFKTYYALIRCKTNDGAKQYHITVMNGVLERLLYGYHIIVEKEDGLLQPFAEAPGAEVESLQHCILHELSKKLRSEKYFEQGLYAL